MHGKLTQGASGAANRGKVVAQMKAPERTKESSVAAWAAIVLAVGGAVLLYPIGSGPANLLFIFIKVCMVVDLGMPALVHHLSRRD